MDSVGEGEGGKIWENDIEICIISCMKLVASPGSMYDTGYLGLVHWDDPEGWYGEGGGFRMGTHVYLWRIHFNIWQNQYNIVKFKKKKMVLVTIFVLGLHSQRLTTLYLCITSTVPGP